MSTSASSALVGRVIEASARHPWPVLLVTAVLAAFGARAMRTTPVDAIPDLTDRQVIVFTEWLGRSPDLVEAQITYPLTTAMLGTRNVRTVRGQSMFGMSFVTVLFEEGTSLDDARTWVQQRLAQSEGVLPEGVRPRLGPEATGVGWVYQYALHDASGRHDLATLRSIQDTRLRYALAAIPGVAEVASVGGYEAQIDVLVELDVLRRLDLSPTDVATALRGANRDVGAGAIEVSGRELVVRGRGLLADADAIGEVVVAVRDGRVPIRVRDVARVVASGRARRGVGELDGLGEAVSGIVIARDGANAREVVAAVKQKLASLEASLPEGVSFVTVYDRSRLVDGAIATLRDALLEEGLVVALVIVIFLLHLRSALVPIVTLPASVLIAFLVLSPLGMTSNAMSLGGIAIAIGAMVDAAIVIVENVHKKLEHLTREEDRLEAIIAGAKEVGPPIFFSLLLVTVSFLPIFGLTGQAGRLFRPLALTKTSAMLAAAIVAITAGPALVRLLVRGRIVRERDHPISKRLVAVYEPFVHVALRNPRSTIAIGVLAVISAVPIALELGEEFMPPFAEGDLLYMPTTVAGISTEEAERALGLQDRALRAFPEVERVYGKIGRADTATDPAPLDMVETTVLLRPRETWAAVRRPRFWSSWAPELTRPFFRQLFPDTRRRTYDELVRAMGDAVRLPGFTTALTMPVRTRIDMLTTGIRTPFGVKVLGDDPAVLERTAGEIERALRAVTGVRSAVAERAASGAFLDVTPRPADLARHGLTNEDVTMLLETAVGGATATTLLEGRRRIGVVVRATRGARLDVDAIAALPVPVRTESGGGVSGLRTVPLRAVADVRRVRGPSMLKSENGRLATYVYVDVDLDRHALSDVARASRARLARDVRVPTGVELVFSGQFEQLEATRERLAVLVPLAVVLVVLLLYMHLGSAIETAIVLATVPFSLVGSVWALYLLDYHLSTAVWVGVVALVGLAAQTGVVMVMYLDQAYLRRLAEGRIRSLEDIIDAHREGTVLRVRPKLMTVATAMMGLVPLLYADGLGADVMKRIAAPMVGGLLTSTFLTLEILPVIYTYWRHWELRRTQRAVSPTAGAPVTS